MPFDLFNYLLRQRIIFLAGYVNDKVMGLWWLLLMLLFEWLAGWRAGWLASWFVCFGELSTHLSHPARSGLPERP